MAKRLVWLVGLAAAVGVTFSLRDSIRPILPGPLVAVLDPLVSAVERLAGAIRTHTGLNILNAGAAPAKVPEQRAPAPQKGAEASKKGAGGSAPVTVASAALADMPVVLAAPGTVEPLATVAIKPRVDGQIVHVGFSEGDMVQAGDVLYRLDDRLVRAQIKLADAGIAKDQASLKDAMSIAERRETLFLKRYATEAATETARQNVEVLKASIAAGQAQLEMQRTQLDYLTIRAPITGRTGSMTARLGSFVRSADPTALLTINQTRPIAVAFALPQGALKQLKDAMEAQSEALIRVSGAKPLTVKGILRFVDNQIDRTTGTVTAKVVVENEGELLWPGLAVNVDLTVETRKNVVTVPASAVLPAQQGMIVWVVGADNRVAVRTVVQDRVIGQTAFLGSGLTAGERVVTDGQLRLSQGAAVAVRGDGQGGGRPGGVGQAPAKGLPAGNGGGG